MQASLVQTGGSATLTITDGINTAVYTTQSWSCIGATFNFQSSSGCKQFPATITVTRCPVPVPPPTPTLPKLWTIVLGSNTGHTLFVLFDLNTGSPLKVVDTAFATNVPLVLGNQGMSVVRNVIYYSSRSYPHIFTYDLSTGGWGIAFQTEFGPPYINGNWSTGGCEMLGFDAVQNLLYVKPHPSTSTFATRLYNTYNFGTWSLQSRIESNPTTTQAPYQGGLVPVNSQNVVEIAPESGFILTGANGYTLYNLTGQVVQTKFIAPARPFAGIDYDSVNNVYYVVGFTNHILQYGPTGTLLQSITLTPPTGVTATSMSMLDISLVR